MRSHGTAHLRKSERGRDETSIPRGWSMLVGLFRVDEGMIDIVRYEHFCHNIQLTSAGLGRRRWRKKQKSQTGQLNWTHQSSYTANLSTFRLTSKSHRLKFKFEVRAIFDQSINNGDEECCLCFYYFFFLCWIPTAQAIGWGENILRQLWIK